MGIQEWGLAFQCLALAANQRTLNSTTGHWLYIMTDKNFPEVILKFISGSGINLQKNHVVSVRKRCEVETLIKFNGILVLLRTTLLVSFYKGWANRLSALLQLFTSSPPTEQ